MTSDDSRSDRIAASSGRRGPSVRIRPPRPEARAGQGPSWRGLDSFLPISAGREAANDACTRRSPPLVECARTGSAWRMPDAHAPHLTPRFREEPVTSPRLTQPKAGTTRAVRVLSLPGTGHLSAYVRTVSRPHRQVTGRVISGS